MEEETAWTLVGDPVLVHVADWRAPEELASWRREFNFLVDVRGDLRAPRLEYPKQVEFR